MAATETLPIDDYITTPTPIGRHGDIWLKRDDLFEVGGARGGKARACWALAQGAKGLITAGSPDSPQMQIVARIANHLGIPARCHCSTRASVIKQDVEDHGGTLVTHRNGFPKVIDSYAKRDAADHHEWKLIPFGMMCTGAVEYTRQQVRDIPEGVRRIVICVGSGMSAAGVLLGLREAGLVHIPVLGVMVGQDPTKTLDALVPEWDVQMTLVKSQYDYDEAVDSMVDDVRLDPIYEAKCKEHLKADDLFWIIGIRSDEAVEALLQNGSGRYRLPPAEEKPTDFDNAGVRLEGMAKNRRLDALATHSNENAIQAETASAGFIKYAFEAGRALVEAKKLVGHTYWTEWLQKEFHKSRETARAYMRLFRKWNHPTMEEARSRGDHISSLDAALKIMRKQTLCPKRPITEEQIYRADLREYFGNAISRLTKYELIVLAQRFDVQFWPVWYKMFREDDKVVQDLSNLKAEVAPTPKPPAQSINHNSDAMPLFGKDGRQHWVNGRLSARLWLERVGTTVAVADEGLQADEWAGWDDYDQPDAA